jgi:hypothetical protein
MTTHGQKMAIFEKLIFDFFSSKNEKQTWQKHL